MQNTPYMMVLLGDFNAKCTNWYRHDKTNFEGIANSYREFFIAMWIIAGYKQAYTHFSKFFIFY